jgi:NADH:ubiquinone oxidoreductase subunit 4 (subunit M)
MYWEPATTTAAVPISQFSRVTMVALMIGIVALGVYPQPVLNALRQQPVTASAPR